MQYLDMDSVFLSLNNLMDYSLLFIKVEIKQKKDYNMKRMPAIIFKRDNEGGGTFIIKAIDQSDPSFLQMEQSFLNVKDDESQRSDKMRSENKL